MFRRLTRIGILSIAALTVGTILLIGWPRESDYRAYRTALEQVRSFNKKSAPPVCQNRHQVCKDLWFSDEGAGRLHYRIESAASSLNMHPIQNKIEIVEQLHTMRCWMQDRLVSATEGQGPLQQCRYFTANEGVYHFLSQSLLAEQATLSLYRLSGDQLPEIGRLPSTAPFLSGKAEQVKMLVSGKTPLFQANNFKASMNSIAE